MVLVDVDIVAGTDDGSTYRSGYSINATGYTQTAQYLDTADPNTISVNTQITRAVTTPTGTANKTGRVDSRGYLLFKGITIPQGSTIDDATLNLTGVSSTDGDMRVYGRKTASPTVPTGNGTTVFTKAIASAFGTTTVPTATFGTFAVDMQSTIQELVNTFDYNNDNMMLIMRAEPNVLPPTPTTTTVSNTIQIRPFEFGGASIPNLTINYTPATTKDFTIDGLIENQKIVTSVWMEVPDAIEKIEFTVDALVKQLGVNGSCSENQFIVESRGERDDVFGPGVSGSTSFGEGMAVRFTPKVNFLLREIDWNSTRGGGFLSGRVGAKLYTASDVPTSGTITSASISSGFIKNADVYGGNSGRFSQFITFWSAGDQRRTHGFDNKGLNDGTMLEAGTEYLIVWQEIDVGTGWTMSTTTKPPGNSSTDGSNSKTEAFLTVNRTEHWNSNGTFTLEVLEITGEEFAFDMLINAPVSAGCAEINGIVINRNTTSFAIDAILESDFTLTVFPGRSRIGECIQIVLNDNPPSLTGREIVDEINIKTDADPSFGFRGKTSRVKNWLTLLRLLNIIEEDGSDPDWYETNWSLV